MEKENKYKRALLLAGKMASSVEVLLNCKLSDATYYSIKLKEDLEAYNKEILRISNLNQ